MKKYLFPTILALIFSTLAHSQDSGVRGRVLDKVGSPVFASISLDTLSLGTTTDSLGTYFLEHLAPGAHRLYVSTIGFEKQSIAIIIVKGSYATYNFLLKHDAKGLREVTVSGHRETEAQKLQQQAYTVNSIDVKPLQNLNLDVNTVLNRSTGVRIRQEGGLGSDFSFSLNGFTGNQVRFFIDGLPTSYLGSSLSFNNIPVNVIERIEVYKGVVPVSLGADALGGAVNIVTSNNAKDFLDVSYSYGSFNTHQAALSSRFAFKKGFVVNTSGFFNYSDNTYVIDASLIDKVTGKISDPQPMRRFNDGYMSGSAMVEAGVIKKTYADRLLIGFIGSGNRKEIQQGANMTKVAGEVFRTDKSFTPTLKYQKNNLFTENLSLKVAAVYTYSQSMTVDTSSKVYDWDGSFTTKSINVRSGELNWDKTLFRFNDHAVLVTATLEYLLHKYHTFTLNNTYSWFQRTGEDPISTRTIAYSNPNTLAKNITGLSYKLSLWQNRWNTTVFVKLFHMDARVYKDNVTFTAYDKDVNKILNHGEGVASTLFITKDLQAKVSYEYTSRMPESYEMFGDGLLLVPNPNLRPEQSHNFNFGLLYGKKFKNEHAISAEVGFVYRKPENMIRLVAIAVTSQYQNLTSASITGYEAAIRYSFSHWFRIELNATYQNLRNTNKSINNFPDPLYKDRVPNTPYLFGNAILGFQSPYLSKYKIRVGLDWSTMFVEKFYLKWPSQGSSDGKLVIPRQVSHDASVTLSSHEGMYNVSFSCLNLADTKRYDNFKVQRPGRGFNVKFRVYITRFKK